MNEKLKTVFGKNSIAWLVLAFCPVMAIMLFFTHKILLMRNFVFGDDFQLLKWFHPGRIAFPLREIVNSRIIDGRFFPLCYENLNIISLLSSDLTLTNLAERCFYVQAGMWCLSCIAVFTLMCCIGRMEKDKLHPLCWCFVPLAVLTMLFTPAFVSYFLLLIFAEARICVIFPLFFLFYFLARKKEKTIYYLLAWLLAVFVIFCKENVFIVFTVICGVQFLFGRQQLTCRHKCFLSGLLTVAGIFLMLYYFIVYRHADTLYNEGRLDGISMLNHVVGIFQHYPVWIFAFILGFFRLIRVLFYHERQHLFMDAMLFSTLGFFISYLLLKLTDWWYWGSGVIVVMPVFFYWLLVYKKTQIRILFFLVMLLCFAVNVKSACRCVEQSILAQKLDRNFLEKVDCCRNVRKIWFISTDDGSHTLQENAYYLYLKTFLEKLCAPGKWDGKSVFVRDFPKELCPEDLCVIWRWGMAAPELKNRLEGLGFQRMAQCGFYEAFICSRENWWREISPAVFLLNANSPACLFTGGWAEKEDWGRWTNGELAKLEIAVPPVLRGKNLKLNCNILAIVHEKKPVCKIRISVGQKLLLQREFTGFNGSFSLHVPAEYTDAFRLPLTIQIINPVSPADLGVSCDARKLGIGIKEIRLELD